MSVRTYLENLRLLIGQELRQAIIDEEHEEALDCQGNYGP